MPPRIRLRPSQLRFTTSPNPLSQWTCQQCRLASLASATTPAAPIPQMLASNTPIQHYPQTQPPAYKPPHYRKSQLHRQYQSLLRSTPLMLLFQHNNLKSVEWMGIRRELATAFAKADTELGVEQGVGEGSKVQIVQTGIFASALKVVEFWDPLGGEAAHGLSAEAHKAAKRNAKLRHGLEPLLSGPIAVLTFPNVSPAHVKAALSILAPSKQFPAPKRRANPGYYEAGVQNGLQKLMFLGARVEGKVFDAEGTKWVGSIEGGMMGLRGQLVAMLQSLGGSLTSTLEAAGRSLYVTVEGRRMALEEEAKSQDEGKDKSEAAKQ
nr:hypothetical protein B0A51_02902 [Rachicladosporium sp. CCFEE 5018]OQO29876.1 hypothetical protein B0A51_02328 [Rachicladosporium sp. CCFEE 5018]